MKEDFKTLALLLQSELEVESSSDDVIDEEALLVGIRSRVSYLLDKDPNLLFSYLYRLDIEESKIKMVLSGLSGNDTVDQLAHLIFDRQLERISTKRKLKQKPIEGWEW